jgi:hypothetical protein
MRILIEEDFSTAQILRRELPDRSGRIGIPVIFVEKDVEPYDLRILLASDVGSGSEDVVLRCADVKRNAKRSKRPVIG